MRRRSALYLPASNLRAIEKARSLAVDIVILDLEDAVASGNKQLARDQAGAALVAGGFAAGETVVRINGLDTEWGLEDLSAAATMPVDAVLVPKVATPAMLEPVAAALPEGVAIWAMIETPRAILDIAIIAAASDRLPLAALVAGTNDLAKEMGVELDQARTSVLPALSSVVMAARAFGLAALDGVFNALEDDAGLAEQCRQARLLGFDGKTLIHPKQIDPCHTAFAPSRSELEEARRMLAAFERPENVDRGAIRFEGRMIERLHLHAAKRLLAETRPN